jgi:hypothetical protein
VSFPLGIASSASVAAAGGGGGGGTITHGEQLTLADVGPWALQGVAKGSETLTTLNSTQCAERVSTWPSDGRPSWIPGTDYVYNNNPSNHGGVVPAGGMTIDGYFVPAGTWVAQFYNFSTDIIISGSNSGTSAAWPGVLFRGCRMRGKYGAPGWFNQNGQATGGIIWITYSDAGGDVQGAPSTNMCESIFESKGMGSSDRLYVIRCHLSVATTLVFMRNSGDACIENYCRDVQDFGDSSKHLNGIGNSGGQTSTTWLRNNMVLVKRADSTQLTDVIQMAADDGQYLGTGTCALTGLTGYQIRDNYLGGAAYTLQLGQDKANTTTASLQNLNVVGNKFTTSLYANSGQNGLGYKGPINWGVQGTWSGNTWADGPNAGNTVASSAVAVGP